MWTIDEVSPTVRPHAEPIATAIQAVFDRVAALAEPRPIAFSLKADRSRVIQRLGHGGFCGDAGTIRLFFDPRNPEMARYLGLELERTIAHEYHHALRWAGPGYGAKLGAQLVSEGLAGQFVRQLYASPPEPWERALDPDDLEPWRAKAYDAFDARDHGHANWFFGANGNPPWLGYTLGYDLVGRYMARNAGTTPFGLAHAPYTDFRETLRS